MIFEIRAVTRSLVRSPFYTCAIILILGFGLGATASLYRVIKDTFFYYRGYTNPNSVVRISLKAHSSPYPLFVFLARFLAYKEFSKTLIEISGATVRSENLLIKNNPLPVFLCEVTTNYFSMLGIRPAIGRGFSPEEGTVGKNRVMLLSHAFWQAKYNGDVSVLNSDFIMSDEVYTVIGILPSDFNAPIGAVGGQIYIPLALPKVSVNYSIFSSLSTLARIREGVSLAQVQAELATISPEKDTVAEKQVVPYVPVVTPLDAPPSFAAIRRYSIMQYTSILTISILYSLACVNVAGLMLVRMLKRRRELAIRLALGGGLFSIFTPLLVEALFLAGMAAVAGAFIARWVMPLLLAVGGNSDTATVPESAALTFLTILATVTGISLAAVVSWALGRIDVNDALKSGGLSSDSLRSKAIRGWVIIIEVALATSLLVGAGHMFRTFQRLQEVNLGYDSGNLYTGRIDPQPLSRLSQVLRQAKLQQLQEAIKAIPGISGVALATGGTGADPFAPQRLIAPSREGNGSTEIQAHSVAATADFLHVLGIPVISGSLERLRDSKARVVVINNALAHALFGENDPIGKQVSVDQKDRLEIVAVVGDIRSMRTETRPTFYMPEGLRGSWTTLFFIRTSSTGSVNFGEEVRRAIYKYDPKLVVQDLRPLRHVINDEVTFERRVFSLLKVTAGFAVALTAAGLVALVGYAVSQRWREIGTRLALGAPGPRITWLLFRESLILVLIGIAGGALLAVGLNQIMGSLLYQTSTHDFGSYCAAMAVLLLASLPACAVPAWLAAQLNPCEVLRAD